MLVNTIFGISIVYFALIINIKLNFVFDLNVIYVHGASVMEVFIIK